VAARLLFAYAPDVVPLQDARGTPELPDELIPLCHLRFVEHVREEAVATIQSFADQGVEIKYLASDRTEDVARVAGQAGLTKRDGAAAGIISGTALAALDDRDFAAAACENEVFGDLMPDQISDIVRALREQDYHVAMVGDGINHIGALRNANLKITVQSGSEAALSVADIVLLNDSLAELSQVLVAGQRIVNGLLDMLKLSLVQICYLPVFLTAALFIGFPYAPAHGTFIALFTLSLPSTGLSLWSSSGAVSLSVMRDRLFHFAVPAGVAVTVTALSVHLIVRATTGDVEYAQLVTAYIVVACGLLLLVFVQPPTRAWVGGDVLSGDKRPALLAIGLTILFIVISFIGLAQHFLHVAPLRQVADYAAVALIAAVWAFVLRFIWRARPLEGPSEGGETAGAPAVCPAAVSGPSRVDVG
jgi:cation-transporting ATPase E